MKEILAIADSHRGAMLVLSLMSLCASASAQCGASGSGSCCESNATKWCDDAECCAAVCALSSFCCNVGWVSSCVTLAKSVCPFLCGECGLGTSVGHPCCTAKDSPYCYDASCCQSVCAELPHCCDVDGPGWNQQCADLAWKLCPDLPGCTAPACGDSGTGNCCSANGTPVCENPACCEAVCDLDPYCCDPDGQWDQCCADVAAQVCVHPNAPEHGLCDPPTCSGYCGSQSPFGCWCDNQCASFADCCPGVCDHCCKDGIVMDFCGCFDVCFSFDCGGKSIFYDCWCDAVCGPFNDCCVNACNVCPNLPQCYTNDADLTGDNRVDVLDLLALLGQWGPCPQPTLIHCDPLPECPADFNGDGVVNVLDLLFLLENWG